jgi:hypothetical protein
VVLYEEKSLQKKSGYTVRIVARILDADAGINKREDHLGKKTRDLRTRFAKCIQCDGEIFESLL